MNKPYKCIYKNTEAFIDAFADVVNTSSECFNDGH